MDVLAKHSTIAWIVEHADTMLTIFLRERDVTDTVQPLEGETMAHCAGNVWRTRGVSLAHEIRTGSTLGGRSVPGSARTAGNPKS